MGFEFDNTLFPNFNKYCSDKFGPEIGSLIHMEAENKLSDMRKEADYRNNKYIRFHMDSNILPGIAMFLTLKEFDRTADKAYEYTDEVLQIFRLKSRKKSQLIGRLPFGYLGFKMICKSYMTKLYPEQGWKMRWIRYDKNEIHFNMESCIYFETTKKYNCPEMCQLFCANDDVVLSGYRPAIVFERGGAIARGQDKCDFHFKNGKYIK